MEHNSQDIFFHKSPIYFEGFSEKKCEWNRIYFFYLKNLSCFFEPPHTDIIIRSKNNRKIFESEEKINDLIAKQPISERYELTIKDNKKRQARTAVLTIKYCKTKIQRPAKLPKNLAPYLEVTIVQAKEVSETIPADSEESAIEWLLVTTHEVLDWQDAIQIVYWYALRWLIEEIFRILKKQGLKIETSQLTTGKGLRKMGIMALQASVRILQLKQARNDINIRR